MNDKQESLFRLPEDAVDLPDEELGALLVGLYIVAEAEAVGIPVFDIPESFARSVVEKIPSMECRDPKNAAIEKALHKAARGDFQAAGKFLKGHMWRGAIEMKFVPIGINKSKQASDFGRSGAELNKAIGVANRQAVLDAAREILAGRERQPSQRELARLISKKIGMPEGTVKGHLQALAKEKLLD